MTKYTNVMWFNFQSLKRAEEFEFFDASREDICSFVETEEGVREITPLIESFIESHDFYAVDLETSRKDGREIGGGSDSGPNFRSDVLSCIQISDGRKTFMIKCTHLSIAFLRPLVEKLATKPWVGQNIKFDLRFIHRDYGVLPPAVFDTEIAAKTVYMDSDSFYNLKALCSRYLNIDLPKDMQKSNWGAFFLTDTQIAYAAKDPYYTYKLFEVLREKMLDHNTSKSTNVDSIYYKTWGIDNVLFNMEMEVIKIFTVMENHGFYVDVDKCSTHYASIMKVANAYIAEAQTIARDFKCNIRAPEQVLQKIKTLYPTEGRINEAGVFEKVSLIEKADKDTLKFFVGKGMPFIDVVYKYKDLTGNIQRLEEFIELSEENRVYPDFRVWGAKTGRTSCKKPNLQNIKNKEKAGVNLKSLFIAPEGKDLIVVDFSQIQLVIIAAMTKDPVMMDVIMNGAEKGIDLHKMTAAAINSCEIADVTSEMRKKAKPCNFGFSFGMGANSFQEYALLGYDVYFTPEEAIAARNRFFEQYQGIAEWHRDIQASRRGNMYYTKSFYGREIWARNFNDATNYPVQAAEAIIMKMSLIYIEQELKKRDLRSKAQLVNLVHDEVIYEVSKDVSQEVFEVVTKNMSLAGEKVLKGLLPVRVEGHICSNWADGK